MADIMIVLLIIFMVITPMLQKGVDVKLPAGGQHQGAKGRAEDDHGRRSRRTRPTFLGGIKLDNQDDLVPQLKEKLEDLPEGGKIDLPEGRPGARLLARS